MNSHSGRQGQTLVEYILMLAVIIVVIVIAANGVMKDALTQLFTDTTDTIKAASGKIKTGLGL
jgi:Flp pilus assembly pilin Flp